jgi:hypothetical protein
MSIFDKNPLLTATLLLTLTACGGGASDAVVPDDTVAPTVSSTTPLNLATSVARDSTITATFNEDMFAKTVDANSFTLAKSGTVDGTVTFEPNTNVATFTPSRELAIHAAYTATLSTDITDLSGNPLIENASWSFTTAEGTWGTHELIETNTGTAASPQVAFDSNGHAIAVWTQYDGTKHNIYANRFNGTAWGTAELIETGDTGNASIPQVALDSNGHAIAVWAQYDGTNINIYANRFNGSDWGTAQLVENETGRADSPQVALDSNGNAIAVWHQRDSQGIDNIYANRFNGSAWGTAELIETGDTGNASIPQVALDSNGNAIAVWYQSDGTKNNIYANRFNGTAWGTAELIETGDDGDALVPQVALDSNGHAIAVWRQWDGTAISIYTNRFNGTDWGTAELIETGDTGNASNPQVALDSNGNAIAVWAQYDGTNVNIYANRFNGTAWGTAELIETGDAGDALVPQVAVDSNGHAIAVWRQADGQHFASPNNIYANRFNGTAWGTAERIETGDAGSASPQVALDSNGNAIAVWTQNDGTIDNIYANRFK